jgi:hypothetical protein
MIKRVPKVAIISNPYHRIFKFLLKGIRGPVSFDIRCDVSNEITDLVLNWCILGLVRWPRHNRESTRSISCLNSLSNERGSMRRQVVPKEDTVIICVWNEVSFNVITDLVGKTTEKLDCCTSDPNDPNPSPWLLDTSVNVSGQTRITGLNSQKHS